MKAVALRAYLPVENPDAFVDLDLPKPSATGHDLLIAVRAVAVNPIDTKVRSNRGKGGAPDAPRVLGFDASGVVESVGDAVTLFKPGDAVWWAGDVTRQGSNAAYQLVDERIVGHKPASLGHAEAAALPLTTITAYESFFHRLRIDRDGADAGQTILIIGGGGGVGSVGIQLAKLAGLTVIATASRPETADWCETLGADHVIDHHRDMVAAVRALGLRHVDHVAIFNSLDHWAAAVKLIRPQGGIVTIDEARQPLAMEGLKAKSASLHWEAMFARAIHQTPDMIEQHRLLTWVAAQIDAGRLRTTLTQVLSPINAASLREAHRLIETGTTRGKIVIEGF